LKSSPAGGLPEIIKRETVKKERRKREFQIRRRGIRGKKLVVYPRNRQKLERIWRKAQDRPATPKRKRVASKVKALGKTRFGEKYREKGSGKLRKKTSALSGRREGWSDEGQSVLCRKKRSR